MSENKKPGFIDLFSGCGGLSLGFLQAGYECIIAVDNEPKAVHCYNLNLKGSSDAGAIQEDLSKLSSKKDVKLFLDLHRIDPQSCDVLVGGPPCQSFSVVGRNKIRNLMETGGDLHAYWDRKDRERTMLFEVFVLFLEVLKPRWFLFENVPTIRNHAIFNEILGRFQNLEGAQHTYLKYNLKYDTYLASKYGVPQDRKRFILIGYRDDIDNPNWNPPEEIPEIGTSAAIGDLPRITHDHKEREIEYTSFPKTPYQQFMREGCENRLFDHVCRWHNSDDIALFEVMKPGAKFADPEVQRAIRRINPSHKLIKYSTDKFKDKLHKLNPNRPAWTVTAHLQKDCYKFIHYDQPRTITVREAARLQSFPDSFRFDGLSMVSSFGLIGNAVAPLMAQAFAESFIISDPALLKNIRNTVAV